MKALLTIPQAAKQLSCTPRIVHQLIDAGQIPVVKLTDTKRGRRINPSDLEQFKQGEKCQSGKAHAEKNGLSTYETAPKASELDDLLGLVKKPLKSKTQSETRSKTKKYLKLASSTHLQNT